MWQGSFIPSWFHPYGHHSFDLLCKSIFCFLYEFYNDHKWIDEASMYKTTFFIEMTIEKLLL